MALYFINAGASPITLPANDGEYVNFAALKAAHPTLGSDTIEVVNNGLIDDSADVVTIPFTSGNELVIRSWGTNGTDRITNKPTILVNPFSLGITFPISKSYTGSIEIDNLKIYKDGSIEALGGVIVRAPFDSITFKVSGCKLWCVTANTYATVTGILAGLNSSPRVFIENCIISKMTTGIGLISFGGGRRYDICNNTLYSCKDSISLVRGGYVYNNIIHGNSIASSYGIKDAGTPPPYTGTIDNNCVYGCTTPCLNFTFPTPNNFTTDPTFIDTVDFKLNAGSPCIEAGANQSVDPYIPSTDFYGTSRPQNTNWDVGAYELNTGSLPSESMSESISESASESMSDSASESISTSESASTITSTS